MTDNLITTWPDQQIQPFLHYLRVEVGLADNTLSAYRRDLARFSVYCQQRGFTQPGELSPLAVQQYAQYLSKQRLASPSVARHLVSVKMFLRFHLLTGLTKKDVCAALESPKTWKRLPGVLSPQKTCELITTLPADGPFYLRDRALLELLYATGMRASEIADLLVGDVNFQVGYLRCIGKGRKERVIPVHKIALEAVQAYLRDLREKLVGPRNVKQLFVSRTGRPMTRIEVWRVVRRAAVAAGMPGRITPHTLRHCFGSHLLQGGADLRVVQELLGHADVATTQIYTHVDQQHLRSLHKKYHPLA